MQQPTSRTAAPSVPAGAAPAAQPAAALRARYLDLMERSLGDRIYGESRLERRWRNLLQRLRHPYLTRRGALPWPSRAHTMLGPQRLRSLRQLAECALSERIPGDFIETGVWRGGACILLRAVLAAHGVGDRRVFCADTFAGLPRANPEQYPPDRGDRLAAFAELAISEEEVRRNFALYDLLDQQVVFLKGLFKDTLPALGAATFALIRLDGDMYESTTDALTHLYDRVSPGGFVIVDDYGALRHCRQAVHDFLDARHLAADIQPVDESCVWWRKR